MSNNIATKAGRKGGRPKKALDDLRKAYGVRLTAKELREAQQRARESNLPFAVFARNAILSADSPRPVPHINFEVWLELKQMGDALVRLGALARIEDDILAAMEIDRLQALLRSTRLALLGIHERVGDDRQS